MANRYSNISTSQFDPLSLQEVLSVPLYKQAKYDQLEADRIKQADMFKIDPLDVHSDRASQLNKDYISKVDELANYQTKTGDIQGSKSKLLDLQREYKKLNDPTGEVSQINTAKQAKAEAYKQWMNTDEAKKYGPDIANKRWLEFSSADKYSGYTPEGKITNIGQMQAPKYEDLQEDIKNLKGLIGSTELTTVMNNGFDMFPQADGSVVVKDGSGNKIVKTNNKQLIDAYSYLKEKWLSPTGEGFKSAQFAGQTSQSIFNKLNAGLGMMREYSEKDTRNDNYSLQGFRNAQEVKETGGAGTIINNNSTLTSDALEYNTYSDALNARKRLESSSSPLDRSKLSDIKELQKTADSKLANNPKYKELDNKLKTAENNFAKFSQSNLTPGQIASKKSSELANIESLKVQKQLVKDKAWKDSSSMRHDYSYLPTTPKEKTEWGIYNEGILNTLQGNNINNLLDLTSIHTTGGTKKNIRPQDVSNIQSLLNGAVSNSFQINNIKTYGTNGTPEITMTFTGSKGSKTYDTKGIAYNDEYGGEDEPVTVTFKLKDFSNAVKTGSAPGFKALSGAIADFWKNKGGVNQVTGNNQGKEVSNAFIQNQYKQYDNKTLESMSHVDSDAKEALLIRATEYARNKNN